MERDLSEFGNGLLGRLMRSPHWLPDRRELVRVAFAPAEQAAPRRTSMLALVPLVGALVAALAS